jgi:dGTPase
MASARVSWATSGDAFQPEAVVTIREELEARERLELAPRAARSAESKGRMRAEPEDDIRPAFQRDRDRIIHCKAFRRLRHKTQVFFAPAGDHYRTRLTHTLEVSQIARTIAKALHLHEDLTEAIALGHDLGHTPFGHTGERILDGLMPADSTTTSTACVVACSSATAPD